MMPHVLKKLVRSGTTHVLFAFLVMGGWAVFANRAYEMPRPLYAGLVQGVLSACLTLFLKSAIDGLAKHFDGLAQLWVPPVIACIGSASVLVAIHVASGTPEILKTITVPLLVSTSYAVIYSYSISARRGART